jgi:hypothetical protein
MPRLVNKDPKCARHKSGQARVRRHGQCIYLGVHGTQVARDAYDAFLAEIKTSPTEDAQPAPVPEHAPLVGVIVFQYFEHAKGYYVRADGSPAGEHVTVRCALRPLTKSPFSTLPAQKFGPLKLQQVQQEMIALEWSRKYMNKAIFIVSSRLTVRIQNPGRQRCRLFKSKLPSE